MSVDASYQLDVRYKEKGIKCDEIYLQKDMKIIKRGWKVGQISKTAEKWCIIIYHDVTCLNVRDIKHE